MASLATHVYTYSYHPFATKFHKRIDLFNESATAFSAFCLVIFSDFLTNAEVKYEFGWMIVYLLYSVLTLNISFIIVFAVLTFIKNRRLKKLREQRLKEKKEAMK